MRVPAQLAAAEWWFVLEQQLSVDLGYPPPASSDLDDPAGAPRRALEVICDTAVEHGAGRAVASAPA